MNFYIYTLGCKVNHYESRVMADILENAGYIESSIDTNVDICIINTCSVTNRADNKSAKTIRSSVRKNPEAIIIVTGCFSQVNAEYVKALEGVDIILGNKYKSKIVDYISDFKENKKQTTLVENMMKTDFEPMKLNNFNKTRAFVKIQDGCNNFCSYCIIPYTRGNVRSKKRSDVLEEIKTLVENGHKEIVLTGIHTGNYGNEFENYDFAHLLEEIILIKGLERLRISSIEMNEINEHVLEIMRKSSVLVDHMHIPLQSGSDSVLKNMNRKYNCEEFIHKIEEIRRIRPSISITTDVIVGFPGETEADFQSMIDLIKKISFSKLHVFPYSKRKGTVAATMENQIEEIVKKERAHILLNISKELEKKYMRQFLLKEIDFIPEVYKEGFLTGHTGNYLNVKCLGEEKDLNRDIKVMVMEEKYPYVWGEKIENKEEVMA